VRESPFKRDILREFVDAARAAGIKPGIYYIVNNNVLLTRTYSATPAELEAIILGQLREIWSEYVRAPHSLSLSLSQPQSQSIRSALIARPLTERALYQ
jgi:hypothetical protein